jgi:hypothetical protein
MRHGRKAGMHHFGVHGKDENIVKEAFHQLAQPCCRFTVLHERLC